MRLTKLLSRFGLGAIVLYAAVTEVFRPSPPESTSPAETRPGLLFILKAVIAGFAACIILQGIGAVLFMASGVYNIAADQPHLAPVRWFLKAFSKRSAKFHTEPERVPNLRDPSLLSQGLVLCRKNCQPCHGAPGVAAEQIGRGINPKPPTLVALGQDYSDVELFWIVSHGLKMSGMPAFDARLSDHDRWAVVAFLREVVMLSPLEYGRLAEQADQQMNVAWTPPTGAGFDKLKAEGNASRGRTLLGAYGCGTCHIIPGIGAGRAGPPLSNFAERQYVAGLLVNDPANLAAWIANPKQFKPSTAMPDLGVRANEALDMTAYLYTLGSEKRLAGLQRAAGEGIR